MSNLKKKHGSDVIDRVTFAQSAKPLSVRQMVKRDQHREGLYFTPDTNIKNPNRTVKAYNSQRPAT